MYKKIIISCILFFTFSSALWAESSPLPMLQKTADQLISQLRQNKDKLHSNPGIVVNLVTKLVLPHVDQTTMARSVVSKNAWEQASAAQKQQFVAAFRRLVIGTYASAFAEYNDETVTFKPARSISTQSTEIQSVINRPGRPSITVNYRLAYTGSSWKIYDFTVEGVSMIQSFRSQLMSPSQQGLGKVIQVLNQHNK